MPITPKSHEFIEGYIFSKIEKTVIQGFMDHDKTIRASVVVPKSWFGLTRALKRKDYTIPEHQVSEIRIELKDAISGYNTDERSYEYDINIVPCEQYIRFVFEGTYVEPVKEMTIEQIEKELGYKIKVVSDMRDYIFRGKNKKTGKLIEGNLLGDCVIIPKGQEFEIEGGYIIFNDLKACEVIPETIGEYTGLTVPSGKIFEHDIVTAKFKSNGARFNFIVKYSTEYGCYVFDNGRIKVPFCDIRSVRIIGNIHDNPELLKGE